MQGENNHEIFIAGGSETIGSRTVDRLLQAGHEVTALARSGGARAPIPLSG